MSGLLRDRGRLAVDLLLLERLHEALRLGIVVGIADPAHAGGNAVLLQQIGVVAAGILDAAVGVVDQAAGPGRRASSAIASAAIARLASRWLPAPSRPRGG